MVLHSLAHWKIWKTMPDRRTLLDQASKARIVMRDQDMPQDLRNMAKSVVDKTEVALGLRAAWERKLGSPEAVNQAMSNLPDPADQSPYPPVSQNQNPST